MERHDAFRGDRDDAELTHRHGIAFSWRSSITRIIDVSLLGGRRRCLYHFVNVVVTNGRAVHVATWLWLFSVGFVIFPA